MWNRSENQVKEQPQDQIVIRLLRHGLTNSNLEHRYLGKTEEPLCEEGIRRLHTLHMLRMQNEASDPVDKLFSSPLLRCRQTASILYPEQDPVLIPEWEEMDFGIFEGKNYKDLQGNPDYQRFIDSGGTLPFPQGESREDFQERCIQGFRRMLDGLQKEDRRIACIVHGGTIMALMSAFCGGDYFDYQVTNGRGYELFYRIQGELSADLSYHGVFGWISARPDTWRSL